MNALILDGATGKRMKPITNWIPKDLMRIDGISLLQRHLDPLQKMNEVKTILVTIHQHEEKVLKAIKSIDKQNKPIISYIETKLQGTAKATLDVWKLLGKNEPLLVIYGDVFFDNPLRLFKSMATQKTSEASLLGYGPLKKYHSGIMQISPLFGGSGYVVEKFIEGLPNPNLKLDLGRAVSHAGLLILDPSAYKLLEIAYNKNKPNKFHLGEHFFPIAIEKIRFYVHNIGSHQDLGTIDQYCDLQERIYNKKLKGTDASKNLKEAFKALLEVQGTIYLIGNGGSLLVAQHTALDFVKAANRRAICLSDPAVITAYANDITFQGTYKNCLKNFIQKEDVLIAFSASGSSHNILEAVEYCNNTEINTIGVTSKSSPLAKISKIAIEFEQSDPKILEDLFSITMHKLTRLLEDVKP